MAFRARSSTVSVSRPQRRSLFGFESLEPRRVLAAYVVTTTNDIIDPADGVLSLREAITEANASPGGDVITFNIPGAGPHTIAPTTPLPPLAGGSIELDATSQPGYAGEPLIEIRGDGLPVPSTILTVSSAFNSIRGLAINRSTGDGLTLEVGSNHTLIADNRIGTDVSGNVDLGNAYQGIYIGSNDNRIIDNVISGNDANGIWIDGTNSANGQRNVLSGNRIGTNASGTAAIPNIGNGVQIGRGAAGNLIGGDLDEGGQVLATAPGNLISGNQYAGVWIADSNTSDNYVLNNLVGTDATGTQALPNLNTGVVILFAIDTRIGLPRSDGQPSNIISGNGIDGLSIVGGNSTRAIVENNFFGTDIGGNLDVGNGSNGIYVDTSENRFLDNLISGNDYVGVYLNGQAGTAGRANVFRQNRVGTNAAGEAAVGNRYEGILLVNGAVGNMIGGDLDANGSPDVAADGNLISGNGGHGVAISFVGSDRNTIVNNKIGTNLTGTLAIGNGRWGVSIVDGADNLVGAARSDGTPSNLISGNQGGVTVIAAGALRNQVENNRIGTDVTGMLPLGNANEGVFSGTVAGWDTGTYLTSGSASETKIFGNVISANGSYGVLISDGSHNVLSGNIIGLDADGIEPLGNASLGVVLAGPNNRVGGPMTEDRNVISGNLDSGLWSPSHHNVIENNYIGTDITGTVDRGNRYQGIVLGGHQDEVRGNLISGNDTFGIWIGAGSGGGYENLVVGNRIGTDWTGLQDVGNSISGIILTAGTHHNYIGVEGASGVIQGNIIAGNDHVGIDVATSDDNVIQGNIIGLGSDGQTALGHPAVGIYIVGSRNQIGGSAAGAGNTVSASGYSGVEVFGAGSSDNVIQGNRIGTDITGSLARPNGTADTFDSIGGVLLGFDTSRTIVGSDEDGVGDATEGNLISGNLGDGIRLLRSTSNRISGNRIGLNAAGLVALPNTANGIRLQVDSNENQIGGATETAGNVISGNTLAGVRLHNSKDNSISGNHIGTDLVGVRAIRNTDGIRVEANSTGNVIGGLTSTPGTGLGNVVSGNRESGIFISSANNRVLGNVVGLDATGNARLANFFQGIQVTAVSGTIIGGLDAGARNVVSGNFGGFGGISFRGSSDSLVQNNYIGTDITGSFDIGNQFDGVFVLGGSRITIGGDDAAAGNLISGNDRHGVHIADAINSFGLNAQAKDNIVKGNHIGISASGSPLGNTQSGIHLFDGADGNLLQENTVSRNGGNGISLAGNNTINNTIRENAIYDNGLLGIDLNGDGVTINDPLDVDVGANQSLNYPVIQSVTFGVNPRATGVFNGAAASAIVIEFFANSQLDPTGFGEGRRYLGSSSLTTDATGKVNFDVTFSESLETGESITATATDASGNTSEFSRGLGLDNIAPTSRVDPLPSLATALSFPVSVTGSDPLASDGTASGVESYEIFVSIDGQPFQAWTVVAADAPQAIFTAQPNHTYGFRSVARDWAGNVESKPVRIEASVYVADVEAPVTEVESVDASAPQFQIAMSGNDGGGVGLLAFLLFVQVDGGSPTAVAAVLAGAPDVHGIYRANTTYQAIADGTEHTYRFYSIGIDRRGNLETAPTDLSSDVVVSTSFPSPEALAITGFDVQRGAVQRSFIRYLDVTVNKPQGVDAVLATLTDSDLSNDRVRLLRYETDGTGPGELISLNGRINYSAVDQAIQIDFGSGGIGGNPHTLSGNGYYALEFDLDGDGTMESVRYFYRLLGDTNGDRRTDAVDYLDISRRLGNRGSNLNHDINADGVINLQDLLAARSGIGRSVLASLPLDD